MTRNALLVVLVLFAAPVSATAQVCPTATPSCHTDDVAYVARRSGLGTLYVDSGFVPAGSPAQVRFEVFLGGRTEVALGGSIGASWPDPIRVAVEGREGGGHLAIDYGFEIRVTMRIDVEVLGLRYRWEGELPIPGVPQDLRMTGSAPIHDFVLPGAATRPVTVADSTAAIRVAKVDVLGGIVSIPGLSGGFALDAALSMSASYQTDRFTVQRTSGPILAEGGATFRNPDSGTDYGAGLDLVARPEGQLTVQGTLGLYPTLYFSLLGFGFDIALFDIPIPITKTSSNMPFTSDRVHVPLPDVESAPSSVDLGMIPVGETRTSNVIVRNDGEAPLDVVVGPAPNGFTVESASGFTLAPGATATLAVGYTPSTAGGRLGTLELYTNDPDSPVRGIPLAAIGFDPQLSDAGTDGGLDDAGLVDADGGATPPIARGRGCGCHVWAPERGSPVRALVVLAMLLVVARRRRR